MDLHLTLLSTMFIYLFPKKMFIVSRIEFRVGTPRIEHDHWGSPRISQNGRLDFLAVRGFEVAVMTRKPFGDDLFFG